MCWIHWCRGHLLLERFNQIFFLSAPLAKMDEEEEETTNLDPPSNDDLLSCSPVWDSDEEEVRMHVLLLQADWAKPMRKRKVLTARAKRQKFAKILRRFRRGDGEAKTCPSQMPYALDVGAPNVELLDLSRPELPPAPAY